MKLLLASFIAGSLLAQPFFQPEQQAEIAQRAAERARMEVERFTLRSGRDAGYQEGVRALDRRDYERAVKDFDRVIASKSPRIEGAYYWKAYALNKLGKRDEALAAVGEIARQFPQSRWLNDAKALEAEVRQANGQAVSPESQSDEDLKLYAINALINSDPERAVPLLEKLMQDAKTSPRLKERALFVLAQSRNEKARAIVTQYATGGGNPDLQLKAVEYLGAFRSKESQQALAGIYASVNDVTIKRAVLRGYMASRDSEHLLAAAKSETVPELRREAIAGLGALRMNNELTDLYNAEPAIEWKEIILRSMSGSANQAKLIEIAKTEKDSRLRMAAVRKLASMGKKSGVDLAPLYNAETDKNVKLELLDAMFTQGAVSQIVECARKESDPELKRKAVQRLSSMKSKEASDFLVELLNK